MVRVCADGRTGHRWSGNRCWTTAIASCGSTRLGERRLPPPNRRAGGRLPRPAATAGHPAREGDCEKIRAGIPAAARRVTYRAPRNPRLWDTAPLGLTQHLAMMISTR